MSNSNWNKKVAAGPTTEAEMEAIRYRGAPLPANRTSAAPRPNVDLEPAKSLSLTARNAVIAAGLSRREE
jgi:hypothetical protein